METEIPVKKMIERIRIALDSHIKEFPETTTQEAIGVLHAMAKALVATMRPPRDEAEAALTVHVATPTLH